MGSGDRAAVVADDIHVDRDGVVGMMAFLLASAELERFLEVMHQEEVPLKLEVQRDVAVLGIVAGILILLRR